MLLIMLKTISIQFIILSIYSWFHENGFFSVHSFHEHYLSIPGTQQMRERFCFQEKHGILKWISKVPPFYPLHTISKVKGLKNTIKMFYKCTLRPELQVNINCREENPGEMYLLFLFFARFSFHFDIFSTADFI